MIRENVLRALDIFECLVKRERKKRDLVVSIKCWLLATWWEQAGLLQGCEQQASQRPGGERAACAAI